MNLQDVIRLRKITYDIDDYGVPNKTVTETEVFARVESVSQAEFFSGGQNGLKPEFRFLISAWEYNKEPEVEYQGVIYCVYRTFRRTLDLMELYVEEKVGV